MPVTSVQVENGIADYKGFSAFAPSFQKHGKKAVIEWQRAIQKRAIMGMKRNKTGKPVKSGRRGGQRLHRPSIKGQYPAVDTGRLWRSIKQRILTGGFEGIVYTNVKYGKFLEEKDPNRGGRPFLTRAAREKEKLGSELVKRAILRSMAEAQVK